MEIRFIKFANPVILAYLSYFSINAYMKRFIPIILKKAEVIPIYFKDCLNRTTN